MLARLYGNLRENELARKYAKEAFDRRERVSELERLQISGSYYATVTGEIDKAVETYELWKQMFPRDTTARNNLAVQLWRSGRFDRALAELREAIRMRPDVSVYRGNLGTEYLSMNRIAEAKAVFKEAVEQKRDTDVLHANVGYWIAFLEGDHASMQREIEWFRGNSSEHMMRFNEAQAAAFEGRLREALSLDETAIEMAQQTKQTETAAMYAAQEALLQAAVGHYSQAKKRAADAVALSTSERILGAAGYALAISGSADAEKILGELEQEFPTFTIVRSVFSPTIRGTIELRRDNPAKAIQLLKSATPYERAFPSAIYARGQAYLQLQSATEAAAEFQKIIDQRGTLAPATPIYPLSVLYPLAHLGLARAKTLSADTAGAQKAYEEFFAIWKNADADIPILIQARREYSQLN